MEASMTSKEKSNNTKISDGYDVTESSDDVLPPDVLPPDDIFSSEAEDDDVIGYPNFSPGDEDDDFDDVIKFDGNPDEFADDDDFGDFPTVADDLEKGDETCLESDEKSNGKKLEDDNTETPKNFCNSIEISASNISNNTPEICEESNARNQISSDHENEVTKNNELKNSSNNSLDHANRTCTVANDFGEFDSVGFTNSNDDACHTESVVDDFESNISLNKDKEESICSKVEHDENNRDDDKFDENTNQDDAFQSERSNTENTSQDSHVNETNDQFADFDSANVEASEDFDAFEEKSVECQDDKTCKDCENSQTFEATSKQKSDHEKVKSEDTNFESSATNKFTSDFNEPVKPSKDDLFDFGDFDSKNQDNTQFKAFDNQNEDFGNFDNQNEDFGNFDNQNEDFGNFDDQNEDFGNFDAFESSNNKEFAAFDDNNNNDDFEAFNDNQKEKFAAFGDDNNDEFADFGKTNDDFGAFEDDKDDFGNFGDTKDDFGNFGDTKDDFGNFEDNDDFGNFDDNNMENFGDFDSSQAQNNVSQTTNVPQTSKRKLNMSDRLMFEKWFPYTRNEESKESSNELIYSHLQQDILPTFQTTSSTHQYNRPSTIWNLLKDMDCTAALKFVYEGSKQHKNLLSSLNVDPNNIVYKGTKKPYVVPVYFAASMNLIDPTTNIMKPMSAAEKIKNPLPTTTSSISTSSTNNNNLVTSSTRHHHSNKTPGNLTTKSLKKEKWTTETETTMTTTMPPSVDNSMIMTSSTKSATDDQVISPSNGDISLPRVHPDDNVVNTDDDVIQTNTTDDQIHPPHQHTTNDSNMMMANFNLDYFNQLQQDSSPPIPSNSSNGGCSGSGKHNIQLSEQDKLDPELLELATISSNNISSSNSGVGSNNVNVEGETTSKTSDKLSKLLATIKKSSINKQHISTNGDDMEELSEEARKQLDNLPDISYMTSQVLMFPQVLK